MKVNQKNLVRVEKHVNKMKPGAPVSAFGLAIDRHIYGAAPELLYLHRQGKLTRHKASGQLFYKKV